MMKLPFHTTAKSTARLLMSIPSYWYCRERAEAQGSRGFLSQGVRDATGISEDPDYSRKATRDSSSPWAKKAAEEESEEPHVLLKYPCDPPAPDSPSLMSTGPDQAPLLGIRCLPHPNFFSKLPLHCSLKEISESTCLHTPTQTPLCASVNSHLEGMPPFPHSLCP